jgi:hypothetical protein
MTILVIAALIVLIVSGVMVLRLKSDPLENKAIKKVLADSDRTNATASRTSSLDPDSTLPKT